MKKYTPNKLYNQEEMSRFIETYNLPRLNNEENLNRLFTGKEIETLIKNSQQKSPAR